MRIEGISRRWIAAITVGLASPRIRPISSTEINCGFNVIMAVVVLALLYTHVKAIFIVTFLCKLFIINILFFLRYWWQSRILSS